MGRCILISKKGESFRVTRGEVVVSNGTKHLIRTKILRRKGESEKIETHSFGPGMEVKISPIHIEIGAEHNPHL